MSARLASTRLPFGTGQNMFKITYLADHPETIPTLGAWFRAQWPDYFAEQTQAEIEADFLEDAHRMRLPVRLLAFAGEKLAGTIVLRERAIPTRPDIHPGLGGLFVPPEHRGRGVGTGLVKAGMDLACNLDFRVVFATTVIAGGILERLGWELAENISHDEEQLCLYRCDLVPLKKPGSDK